MNLFWVITYFLSLPFFVLSNKYIKGGEGRKEREENEKEGSNKRKGMK